MSVDREIDRLYQLPLSEFTKARDELAKRATSDRAAIRRLQKPSVPAWAVNLFFWQDRAAYHALITSAERRRAAQLGVLAGKSADLGAVEAEYARARKSAADRVRALLKEAGEPASASTMNAINETLEALPGPEGTVPGRLTRPLKPMGFEALTGLVKPSSARPSPATVLPFKAKAPAPKEIRALAKAREAERAAAAALKRAEVQAQREEASKQKARSKLASALRDALAQEKRARTKVDRIRRELETAEDELAAAEAKRRPLEAQLKSF
jgi:hypothetical protein